MAEVVRLMLLYLFLRIQLSILVRGNMCEDRYGSDRQSSPYGDEYVIGLFPNGNSTAPAEKFKYFIQAPVKMNITASRPAQSWINTHDIEALPGSFVSVIREQEVEDVLSRTTGLHTGTFRMLAPPDHEFSAAMFGYNPQELNIGGTAVIPAIYLGQEYFVVVGANPGLGQVVISSTGAPTSIRLTSNANFNFDGTAHLGGKVLDIEIPAWQQAVISTAANEFTGSRIVANASVSVVSGSSCAYGIGATSGSCDYTIEQLVSFDRWGTVFNLAPFLVGTPGYFVLVVAGRDSTNVFIDGTVVHLNQGGCHSHVVESDVMLRITSDLPIQVAQIMRGATSMVMIPPEEQYTAQTTYFCPKTLGTSFPTFHFFNIIMPCRAEGNLYVTRRHSNRNNAPVAVHPRKVESGGGGMCAYSFNGTAINTYEISSVDTNVPYYSVVYGVGPTASSYGYAYFAGQQFTEFPFRKPSLRSSRFELRYRDKNFEASPTIQTFENQRSQLSCTNLCIGTTDCRAYAWNARTRQCTLNLLSYGPDERLVHQPGTNVLYRE